MAWQARPVFISSTFADMQAERDHLRTYVFPELEERLRTRRHTLEWVDLRMGVATASLAEGEARELQVLKVCLAEIKRCRPFLIVLLGDRYGWVPPAERIAAAANEEGFESGVSGSSVTDLEISFGVLDDRDQQPRSVFYFRDPLPYADMPPDVAALHADAFALDPQAAARVERLTTLKQRIAANVRNRVWRYSTGWDRGRQRVSGLEAWGRQVLEDIWAELDAETASSAAAPEPSWRQVERDALDDYFEDSAFGFVGRQAILARLLQHAASSTQEGTSWGICLTGDPGSGKSAIFGELLRQLRASGALVLAHAAGASTRAPSVESMLRRWIEELATDIKIDAGLPENAQSDTIDATFRSLLARRAQHRRVVLAVDALDQFEGTIQGRQLTWLPHMLPVNVRLIATAVPGEPSEAIRQRSGIELQPLAPLDAIEARAIVEALCARYHRTLEPHVLDSILAKTGADGPAWGNPLWLVLAVEELNLLDADDFARAKRSYIGAPAEQLRALMLDLVGELPADISRLYRASFERAEQIFDIFLARAFIGFIAVSRAGWREADFRSLLPRASGAPWDELRFASLRRLFRGQIRQRGVLGLWDFSHGQMRAAVRQYLTSLSITEAEFHTEVVDHLLMLPADDPLRQSEAMVHLLGSGDLERAAMYYGAETLSQLELEGATSVLAAAILNQQSAKDHHGLDQVLCLLNAANFSKIEGTIAHRLMFDLDALIVDRVELADRATLFNNIFITFERLAKADPGNLGWQRDLAATHAKIGHLLRAQGKLSNSLASHSAAHTIFDRLAKADPGNFLRQYDLSVSQANIGDMYRAQGNLAAALEAYKAAHFNAERLAEANPADAAWQRNLAASHESIGTILYEQGHLSAALAAYQAMHAILDVLAMADPRDRHRQRDLSVSHDKIGGVLRDYGKLPAALVAFQASRAITDRLAKTDPGNAGWQRDLAASHMKIGTMHHAQGNLQAALEAFNSSLAIVDRLVKADSCNAGWQHDLSMSHEKIGAILHEQNSLPAALSAYQAALGIADRLAKADRGNAEPQVRLAMVHGRIGDVFRAQGNFPGSLAAYQAAHEIADELAKADSGNTVWQHHLAVSHGRIGEGLQAQGNLPTALASHWAAHAIFDRLAKADPGNAQWQFAVAVSLQFVGLVAAKLSRRDVTLVAYRRGHEIMQELVTSAPDYPAFRGLLDYFDRKLVDLSE